MTTQKHITILGAGKIGLALATLWARAGHVICLGVRHPEKLSSIQQTLGTNVTVKKVKQAAAENEIIVLAVPYAAIPELIAEIKTVVSHKIIIDATNPFGISPEGHVISTLGSNITSGSYMASLLPESKIVRAFSHIMEELLVSRGTKHPGLFAVAIAGDDLKAKEVVALLVKDTGFVPVDIGTLAESAPLDPGGILFPQFFTPADMQLALKRKSLNH
jgi:predicted dinucleotide-binding enzyme